MEIVFVKAISHAAIHRAKQYGSTKLVFLKKSGERNLRNVLKDTFLNLCSAVTLDRKFVLLFLSSIIQIYTKYFCVCVEL